MFESLFEALQMSFMQRALAATLAMSLLCPVMGLFLVLRRSSMTGDALSHSSLAGAAAALALGVNPVVGTFVFTAVCGLMIEALRSVFRHYGDLVLTIVQALSVGAHADGGKCMLNRVFAADAAHAPPAVEHFFGCDRKGRCRRRTHLRHVSDTLG